MDLQAVRKAYARWAPIYDWSFGFVSGFGRAKAIEIVNGGEGRVLEVGVGTGLSLPHYARHLEVTGIDLSAEMLERARGRVRSQDLGNIAGLHEMDASDLTFPDGYFNTVVAMFVMTVVPEPKAVMVELERVCAPGGKVLLLNHFRKEGGVRGTIEKALAPHSQTIGWRADFPVQTVLTQEGLALIEARSIAPVGLFTLLHFEKRAA
jgi:phosphatidylethanolamine/phosphatidyl-N-methylethanolamine N-methyltransferase